MYVGWNGGGCFEEVGIERLTISQRNRAKARDQGEH